MSEILKSNSSEGIKRNLPTYFRQMESNGLIPVRINNYEQNKVVYIKDIDNLKPRVPLPYENRLRHFTTAVLYESGLKIAIKM